MGRNLERVQVCQFPYRKLDSYAIILPTASQSVRVQGGRHLFLPPKGLQLAPEGAATRQGGGSGSARSRRAPPAGRGEGSFQPSPAPVISAGVTVAPVAGTSPEPQGAGSRGAVPHSCTPQPNAPSPRSPPLEFILTHSPKNQTSF